MDWKEWGRAAGIRALKTAAQTAVALIPAAATIQAVDWPVVAGTAALAGVCSLLTSLAGLPELGGAGVSEITNVAEVTGKHAKDGE